MSWLMLRQTVYILFILYDADFIKVSLCYSKIICWSLPVNIQRYLSLGHFGKFNLLLIIFYTWLSPAAAMELLALQTVFFYLMCLSRTNTAAANKN